MKKKIPAKIQKDMYTASMKLMGVYHVGKGKTLQEAIENIPIMRPPKTLGILTVSKGSIERIKIMPAMQVFKLFSPSRIMHEVALKNICGAFSNI